MARDDGPISATYLNPMRQELLRYAADMRDWLLQQLYASGYPVNTQPNTDHDKYATLVALKMAGHPEYWHSQAAQDELAKLELQFGPSPNPQPAGFSGAI